MTIIATCNWCGESVPVSSCKFSHWLSVKADNVDYNYCPVCKVGLTHCLKSCEKENKQQIELYTVFDDLYDAVEEWVNRYRSRPVVADDWHNWTTESTLTRAYEEARDLKRKLWAECGSEGK